jgi:glutamate racemase
MANSAPIGVFDSGVGGLSVLREIHAQLPNEALLYVADSGHVPYGEKSAEFIRERSQKIAEFLLAQGAKALVLACNTATVAAVADLRERYPQLPIVGMEPAVKPAASATRSGVVGVLATTGTLKSARFAALLDRFASDVRVVTQPCPGLVECVEAGDLDSLAVRQLLQGYVDPLLAAGCDTLILGSPAAASAGSARCPGSALGPAFGTLLEQWRSGSTETDPAAVVGQPGTGQRPAGITRFCKGLKISILHPGNSTSLSGNKES